MCLARWCFCLALSQRIQKRPQDCQYPKRRFFEGTTEQMDKPWMIRVVSFWFPYPSSERPSPIRSSWVDAAQPRVRGLSLGSLKPKTGCCPAFRRFPQGMPGLLFFWCLIFGCSRAILMPLLQLGLKGPVTKKKPWHRPCTANIPRNLGDSLIPSCPKRGCIWVRFLFRHPPHVVFAGFHVFPRKNIWALV